MLLDKNKLKSLRAQRGWTQQHLADVCDINIRTIQRLEKSGGRFIRDHEGTCEWA